MKVAFKNSGLAAAAIVLAIQQTTAFAQSIQEIDISYSPGTATSIPTLSEWAMLGLSLLLAAIAVYKLRNRAGGKPLASVILASAIALGGVSGSNLMGRADAAPTWSAECSSDIACSMSNANGGIVYILSNGCNNTVTITNSTGITQTVTQVSYLGGATRGNPGAGPECVASQVLGNGSYCTVYDQNGPGC